MVSIEFLATSQINNAGLWNSKGKIWIALHAQGQGASLGWNSLPHPSRGMPPGDTVSYRLFLSHVLSYIQCYIWLVKNTVTSQLAAIIMLTTIYSVPTMCQIYNFV